MQYDLFPRNAACKCYFYDNLGVSSDKQLDDSSDWRFNDVLRRRFLRQGVTIISIFFIFSVSVFDRISKLFLRFFEKLSFFSFFSPCVFSENKRQEEEKRC